MGASKALAAADGRFDLPRKSVIQLWAYHLALFLVMISYYALALALCLCLAGNGVIQLIRVFTDVNSGRSWLMHGLWLLATLVMLFPLLPLIWSQFKGLITAQHDENDQDALFGLALAPERYSELFERVAAVAKRIGAPPPDEIRVTPEPQCHAVEVRRFRILSDRKLVLVLGMPHLCVMSCRELDVILAHELAHVRAGDTRMSVFVFRFLESLEAGAESVADSKWRWLNPLYLLSRLYVAAMRPLTAPLIRRQEMLADVASAMAFGGDLAATTLLKEWQIPHQFHIAVASCGADHDLNNWRGLFRAFRESWQEFSDDGYQYLLKRLEEEERPSFWDSHPPTGARIAMMREFADIDLPEQAQGPALACKLFPDFDALEERMSTMFAREIVYGQEDSGYSIPATPDSGGGTNTTAFADMDETTVNALDQTVGSHTQPRPDVGVESTTPWSPSRE